MSSEGAMRHGFYFSPGQTWALRPRDSHSFSLLGVANNGQRAVQTYKAAL